MTTTAGRRISRWQRACVAAFAACALGGTPVAEAAGPDGTPGRQGEAEPPDPFIFTSDAALLMYTVDADAATDFEIVWRVIRQRVASSDDAAMKALLDSMKLFQPETADGASVTYVFYIDPVVGSHSYSPTYVLFESGLFERAEADELFAKLTGALVAPNPISTMPINLVP